MAELIFEVGCEDLPARFVEPALKQLKENMERAFEAARLQVQGVRTLGTPRRLTLVVSQLSASQGDLEEERLGPPVSAAYRDGQPTKAAQGFARGQGVAVEDLYTVQTERGEYVAAKVFEVGKPTVELLPALLEQALSSIHLPKSMRWGAGTTAFARPIRWLVASFDGQLLPVSYGGVVAGVQTFGHRFSHPGAFEVTSIDQYISALEAADVIVDIDQRRASIQAQLKEIEAQTGGEVIPDEGLLDEVLHLVECPFAVCVRYDASYLELPPEVLILSMRSHQRYFALRDPQTKALLNACVVIYNSPVRDADVVRAGNLRVLKARLADAWFFWHQDLKQSLEERVALLGNVVWLAGLGSVKDRTERIGQLAGKISATLGLDAQTQAHAARAGLLSKADLVSQMVFEFTELQGVMGRAYARKSGEPEVVAQAIYEQYLPKGADDELPTSDVGATVALAERLDTLVGTFGVGFVPKSNADPYGLRRAALGVLRVIVERAYGVGLQQLLALAYEVYEAQGKVEAFKQPKDALLAQVDEFVTARYKHLLAASYPTDVVDAVLEVASDEILAAQDRVAALASLRGEPDFEPLAIGFKRVVNILRKQADSQYEIPASVDPERFEDQWERALYEAALAAQEKVQVALQARDWGSACQALIALKQPIDDFFDHVMVMAQDEALRKNRLAILNGLRELFMRVADISKIQTEA